MSYGHNPNLPEGSIGHTMIPLPGSKPIHVKAAPVLIRKGGVSYGDEDDIDYSGEDPNYVPSDTTGTSSGNGIWQELVGTPQHGDTEVDMLDGDTGQDSVIYGDNDDPDVGDDVIDGDDLGDGEMSEQELNDVIEGDPDEMDAIINGTDPDEMSDAEFNSTVYGDDEPDENVVRTKKRVYRVARPRTVQQRPANTGMGMVQ